MRNGTVSPREPSAPLTVGTGSSSSRGSPSADPGKPDLPTPTAYYGSSNNGSPGDGREAFATAKKPSLWTAARAGLLPTPIASDGSGKNNGLRRAGAERVPSVSSMARSGALPLPSPTTSESSRTTLPTPTSSDGTKAPATFRKGETGRTLGDYAVAGMLPTPTANRSTWQDAPYFYPTLHGMAHLGALPTPTQSDGSSGPGGHRGGGPNLRTAAAAGMLPTPLARDSRTATDYDRAIARLEQPRRPRQGANLVELATTGALPTPTTHDSKGTGPSQIGPDASRRSPMLNDLAQAGALPAPAGSDASSSISAAPHSVFRGPLSPAFVEWMMGFPKGHTDLLTTDPAREARAWGIWENAGRPTHNPLPLTRNQKPAKHPSTARPRR